MSLDSFMAGVLSAMTPIVTPDWGKLVVLIPALLTLVVLAYLAVTAFKWVTLFRAAPASPRASAGPRARAMLQAPLPSRQIEAPAHTNDAPATSSTAADAKPSRRFWRR